MGKAVQLAVRAPYTDRSKAFQAEHRLMARRIPFLPNPEMTS